MSLECLKNVAVVNSDCGGNGGAGDAVLEIVACRQRNLK